MNKNLRPVAAAPAAVYEPVQKHKVTPSILGWLNYSGIIQYRITVDPEQCTQWPSFTCANNIHLIFNIPWSSMIYHLTLKQLHHFAQNVSLIYLIAHSKCISVWISGSTLNTRSVLWILVARCFSTRASVTTMLVMHPLVSSCNMVNTIWTTWYLLWVLWDKITLTLKWQKAPVSNMRWNVGQYCSCWSWC